MTDESADLSYQIRYVEENHRSSNRPWSIRQTGVYHYHCSNQKFDLFIFLHPIEYSSVEQTLMSLAQPSTDGQEFLRAICKDPFRLHMLPMASYLDNWRWYFRYLDEEFEDMVCLFKGPPIFVN